MHIKNHPGYSGAFTKEQAEGAIPNGTVIEKIAKGDDDTHSIGDRGKVLGSIGAMGMIMYFIEWEDMPRMAVATSDWKVREA